MSPSGVSFPYDPYDPHPAIVTRGPSLLRPARVVADARARRRAGSWRSHPEEPGC